MTLQGVLREESKFTCFAEESDKRLLELPSCSLDNNVHMESSSCEFYGIFSLKWNLPRFIAAADLNFPDTYF